MEKLNLAKLLKDCPTGMELDCTLFEGLEFDCIVDNEYLPIRCRIKHPNGGYTVYNFTKYGCWFDTTFAKCVIFPKGKTTWEGFQRPFKDGDVIYNQCIKATAIFYKQTNDHTISHCFLNKLKELKINHYHSKSLFDWRLATEEEKERLFKTINDNGYCWNPETKTLEKLIVPKFKVGDRIKKKGDTRLITIKDVRDNYYIITFLDDFGHCYVTDKLSFSKQDDYELVPNKFDITTLKPFDRVLTRVTTGDVWGNDFFGYYKDGWFHCSGHIATHYCIPFEGNQHLLGTNNDCDEYYKTWE